jgi:hypothetical protein
MTGERGSLVSAVGMQRKLSRLVAPVDWGVAIALLGALVAEQFP